MGSATSQVSGAAEAAANSRPMGWLARVGLTSRGVVYLPMGWLAVLVATGSKQNVDQRGVLTQVVDAPFGTALVVLLAAGFAAYGVWRLTEAATGPEAFDRAADPVGVREALALAGLLGRRSAELGASAVELAAVVEALLAVVGDALSVGDRQGLRGLVLEGYTRALLERDREMQLDARIRVTRPFGPAPPTLMPVPPGAPGSSR